MFIVHLHNYYYILHIVLLRSVGGLYVRVLISLLKKKTYRLDYYSYRQHDSRDRHNGAWIHTFELSRNRTIKTCEIGTEVFVSGTMGLAP